MTSKHTPGPRANECENGHAIYESDCLACRALVIAPEMLDILRRMVDDSSPLPMDDARDLLARVNGKT